MTIRQANINDLEKVNSLFKNVLTEIPYYNDLAKQTELNHYNYENLIAKIKEDPYSVIVCETDNRIVGFVFNRFDDYTIWLEWIVSDKEYRNKGIGIALLNKLVEYTLKRNCHKIWCDCRTTNSVSKNFLENFGFKFLIEIKNHWYKQDFNLFEKVIDEL